MSKVDGEQVKLSRAIQKKTGRTFYFATLFLPKRVRKRTHVLYAFFRICDEVVDDYNAEDDAEMKRRELDTLLEQALGNEETDEPVVDAFSSVREEHDIPEKEVVEFVGAMKTDITKSRYEDFEELRGYMRGSAAAVGNMMTCIMGVEDYKTAKPHAEKLGEAFQMTNFVRDVREDAEKRNRVYLPLETLRKHGVTEEDVLNLEDSEGLRDAVREEIHRTEELYREGVEGIRLLPADCRFPVLLAAVMYVEHHRLIRARDYDVISSEPSLGTLRKLSLYVRTRLAWARKKDAVDVFEKVSAVKDSSSETSRVGRIKRAVPFLAEHEHTENRQD
ncbi:MAG: phytoene/squalene synthase family protein [Halobacteriales archaeon]|nr:phytoene/squalene synthase family protein [Halobacteriales archaeon]